MIGRKSPRAGAEAWVVTEVSDQAQQAAADAAHRSGMALEIWLAETVLRASQEGIDTKPQSAESSRS